MQHCCTIELHVQSKCLSVLSEAEIYDFQSPQVHLDLDGRLMRPRWGVHDVDGLVTLGVKEHPGTKKSKHS